VIRKLEGSAVPARGVGPALASSQRAVTLTRTREAAPDWARHRGRIDADLLAELGPVGSAALLRVQAHPVRRCSRRRPRRARPRIGTERRPARVVSPNGFRREPYPGGMSSGDPASTPSVPAIDGLRTADVVDAMGRLHRHRCAVLADRHGGIAKTYDREALTPWASRTSSPTSGALPTGPSPVPRGPTWGTLSRQRCGGVETVFVEIDHRIELTIRGTVRLDLTGVAP